LHTEPHAQLDPQVQEAPKQDVQLQFVSVEFVVFVMAVSSDGVGCR
jgi:hypothetical protein